MEDEDIDEVAAVIGQRNKLIEVLALCEQALADVLAGRKVGWMQEQAHAQAKKLIGPHRCHRCNQIPCDCEPATQGKVW